MYTTVSITMVSKLAPPQSRGAHLSFYLSMFLLGTTLGPAIGGTVSFYYGLNAPFLVYGICGGASFALVYTLITEVKPVSGEGERITLRQLSRLVSRYEIVTINLATISVFIVRQGILNTIVPLYAMYNLGIGEEVLGIMLTLGAAANLVTMLVAGRMTDLYGRKPFMITSLLLLALLVAMLPFVSNTIGLTIVLVGIGLSIGLTGPIAAWVSDVTEPKDLGGAMGLFRTMGDLGFVIAPVTLAALAGSAGGTVGFMPFLAASLMVVLFCIPLIWTKDPVGERRAAEAQHLR
jgi:MFS family permease